MLQDAPDDTSQVVRLTDRRRPSFDAADCGEVETRALTLQRWANSVVTC